MGPLINEAAVERMAAALEDGSRARRAKSSVAASACPAPGFFVEPAIVRARPEMPIVAEETFAPILYVMTYRDFDEAVAAHNDVSQGLSSAVFTDRLREAERFLARDGQRLRDRQREYRDVRGRNRRRVRRRKRHRRRPRVGFRFVESLHAAADVHDQLGQRPAAGARASNFPFDEPTG